jgi:hypothetical protein
MAKSHGGYQDIDRAIKIGAESTSQNNNACFQACLALLEIRNLENLESLSPVERKYFANAWYEHLKALSRTKKHKGHYLNDILQALQNAKRNKDMKSKNPVPHAWTLAQTEPPPPEAEQFREDQVLYQLTRLCWQLHLASGKGIWFLPQKTVANLMGMNETDRRHRLPECFMVLIGYSILEEVEKAVPGSHKSTTYRYIEQPQSEPEPVTEEGTMKR